MPGAKFKSVVRERWSPPAASARCRRKMRYVPCNSALLCSGVNLKVESIAGAGPCRAFPVQDGRHRPN